MFAIIKKTNLAISRLSIISFVRALATQPGIQSTSRVSFSPIPAADLKQRDLNPLAGRKYLPGSWSQTFPKYLANPREDFPYAVQLENPDNVSFSELGKLFRKTLDTNLPRASAVLLRGTGIQNLQNFKDLVQALDYKATNYKGGTGNREVLDPLISVSTADPMEFNIELHNEMADTPYFNAHKAIFCCLQPPGPNCGGLTPISKNSNILASLDPEVVEIIKKRKIRYLRYVPDASEKQYASWQQSFMTDDKKVVEDFLRKGGISNYAWTDKNQLTYWYTLDAFIPHPVTGKPIWFNQIENHHYTYLSESPMYEGVDLPPNRYPFHTQYGDGEEIDPEIIDHVRSADWSNAVGFDWKKGDVIVIDNLAAKHARLSYTGPRKLLVSLTSN
ncbi:uncharacterized protein LOC110253358 [Exaiptasia diaphana]|uniref:TauD/TfdA-like domain-containing protein n=1 Tax=Exaiptasia diaphana TaxID=2652724 RepID=A0A913Y8E9_EXADI|nr:uncharacterized protein LOC110253358 [Exaiptasia diaphana]